MGSRSMDNVKNDAYYIRKIVTDVSFVLEHTAGLTQSELEQNEVLFDCVMFRLIQVSENSARLTADFRTRYNSIPWQAIKGLRNRIVHDYGEVEKSIVYDTIKDDLPALLAELQGLE